MKKIGIGLAAAAILLAGCGNADSKTDKNQAQARKK